MAEAVLTLRGDASPLLDVLGRVRVSGRSAARALARDFADAAREAGAAWEEANRRTAAGYGRLRRLEEARAQLARRASDEVRGLAALESDHRGRAAARE